MLNSNTLEAIAPFVEHNSGSRLTAIPGSALSTLTQSIIEKYQVLASVKHDEPVEYSIDDIVQTLSAGCSEAEGVEHTGRDVLNDTVRLVTKTMRNNIYLTRSVVLPMIDEYAERLSQVVNDKCSKSVLALNIVEDTKLTIITSPQLKAIVSDQKQRTNYRGISLPRYHSQDLSIPELSALIATGNTTFDKLIADWVKVNTLETQLKGIYTSLFVGNDTASTPAGEDSFINHVNIATFDTALLALLMCWGLVKNTQEGLNISLNDYTVKMQIFAAACCGVINQAISRYERNAKNKTLVVQYPASNRQFCYDELDKNHIVVNSETYAKFLELGGSPEMIFGSYLTDRQNRMGTILENSTQYVKEYNTQIARGKLTALNNTLTIVQSELRDIAFDIAKRVTEKQNGDPESDISYSISFTGNEHMKKASDFINALNVRHLDDFYATVRSFVCSCFFEGSMALDLLNRIDALDPEGEKDINELALISTVDLVVDWFVNQIETKTDDVSLEGYYVR